MKGIPNTIHKNSNCSWDISSPGHLSGDFKAVVALISHLYNIKMSMQCSTHINNVITNSSDLLSTRLQSDITDAPQKAIFFKKFHELKQAYGQHSPELVCETIRIFGTAFYGSPLWSLNSVEHL